MARPRFGFILAVALSLVSPLGHAVVPPLSQPSWAELTTEHRRVLAPLSAEWDKMEGFRRVKWLGVAQRYQGLSSDEQARVQQRMIDWAKLTPDERKRARDKYKSMQKASPEKKEEVKLKWQEYKELPESEQTRLKTEASRKPTPQLAPPKQSVAKEPTVASNPPPAIAPSAQTAPR